VFVKSQKTPSPLMPACACPHADRGEGMACPGANRFEYIIMYRISSIWSLIHASINARSGPGVRVRTPLF